MLNEIQAMNGSGPGTMGVMTNINSTCSLSLELWIKYIKHAAQNLSDFICKLRQDGAKLLVETFPSAGCRDNSAFGCHVEMSWLWSENHNFCLLLHCYFHWINFVGCHWACHCVQWLSSKHTQGYLKSTQGLWIVPENVLRDQWLVLQHPGVFYEVLLVPPCESDYCVGWYAWRQGISWTY